MGKSRDHSSHMIVYREYFSIRCKNSSAIEKLLLCKYAIGVIGTDCLPVAGIYVVKVLSLTCLLNKIFSAGV